MMFWEYEVYSQDGPVVTKSASDDGIPGKSRNTLKYYNSDGAHGPVTDVGSGPSVRSDPGPAIAIAVSMPLTVPGPTPGPLLQQQSRCRSRSRYRCRFWFQCQVRPRARYCYSSLDAAHGPVTDVGSGSSVRSDPGPALATAVSMPLTVPLPMSVLVPVSGPTPGPLLQ
ncbi:hypothetical protein EVAR_18170_1 [Eumeta japonica]|uniref:Uncharacterized protein n=1 Tax=Eumeta variegata TaxID=151549 RepID=A0A4C1UV56_EUMVA|nr:hypothetical protein EVAR_18170_1 [Eumeta japonica]